MPSDALLQTSDRQEALSRAYASAVAAAAGYTTTPPSDFDRDSIDIEFGAGGQMRPKIGAQLKATTNLTKAGSTIKFSLKLKNYNDLRIKTQTPRILVVLDMPTDKRLWVTITADQLVMRKAAYWVSLLGMPDVPNTSTVTINIPSTNLFNVSSLKELMEKSRKGTAL